VIPSIEKLPELVAMATKFFKSRSDRRRNKMKSLIQDIRQDEKEADFLERELKLRIFDEVKTPWSCFTWFDWWKLWETSLTMHRMPRTACGA